MSWSCPENHIARLERPPYVFEVAVDRPWQGLHFDAKDVVDWNLSDTTAAAIRPLQFSATPSVAPNPERLDEMYIRGDELFAVYQELPGRDVHPRAVWRDLYAIVRQPAVELRLYMQTRWLESQPKIDLCTTFPAAAEIRVLRDQQWRPVIAARGSELMLGRNECDGGFLIRPPDAAWSYGELIYATDFQGATLRWGPDEAALSYPIFLEPLEKGVVRVGRVWSVWLDRDSDERQLLEVERQLQTASLPLTA